MKLYPAVKGHNSRGFTDWVFPKDSYRLQCCDCLMVHAVEFRVVREVCGKAPVKVDDPRFAVAFRVRRMDRLTAKMRKARA